MALKLNNSVGLQNGLELVLDLHSDKTSPGTLYEDYRGFQVFIGQPAEFPVLRQRNLLLKPGRAHFLDLTPTIFNADSIDHIRPEKRKCKFVNEGDLKLYEMYSHKSCLFECQIK